LMKNWQPVDNRFKREKQSVAFRATAFPTRRWQCGAS
jgi:hypothetical protein